MRPCCCVSQECRAEASKMREDTSLHDKVIDQSWVLKRKRKRISSGLEPSNGKVVPTLPLDSPRDTPLSKRKLKGDINISRFGNKQKGHDGHYFECIECDLGGNLLCCDSCPRTYHLECLRPPLKSTPPGKWQCPNCQEQKDYVKRLNMSAVGNSRHASKSTSVKSKTVHKLAARDKASLSGRSSFKDKDTSKNKGRGTFSRRAPPYAEKEPDFAQVDTMYTTRSSHLLDIGSRDGISTPLDKAIESGPGSLCHQKTSSPKKVHFLNKSLSSDPSDKSPEEKPGSYKTGMQGKNLNLSLAQSSKKSKKKGQKLKRGDHKKITKSEKGKNAVNTTSISETKGLPQKHKSFDQRNCASVIKEDFRAQKLFSQRLPEISPGGTTVSSYGLDEQRVEVDKGLKYDVKSKEFQQVHRILGCRMQSSSVLSSFQTQTIKSATSPSITRSGNNSGRLVCGLPSCDFARSKNCGELLDDCYVDRKIVEVKDGENVPGKGCHSDANGVGVRKDTDNTNQVVKSNERNCRTKESMDEAQVMMSETKSSKDQCFTEEKCEVLDDSAVNAIDIGQVAMEKVTEEFTNLKYFRAGNHGISQIPGHSQVYVTCDSEGSNVASIGALPDNNGETKILREAVQESGATERDGVMYEFLVKWVGKSNIHNSWVSESDLKVIAKRKLENYKAKYGTAALSICDEQWSEPHRVIALRVSDDGNEEALVKWCGLPYDECTWERLDESIIEKSAHLIAEFKQFESQTLDKNTRDDFPKIKGDCQEVVTLTEQPKELQGGSLFPHQLEALNWLRKCWHKSKNVILADEMGLGKTISACAFVSSLYFEFKANFPCLILVPLSTMPNWLAEFALWAPHLNVLEYHGCAKARSVIRRYEWHASDPDGLHKMATPHKFNILLTTYEMLLADSSYLRTVPWEVLVVDEGHRLKNSGSKLFGLLNTFSFQHRVLLTGTPLQNNIGELYNLLNFLQPVSFPSLSAFEEKFNDLTTSEKVEELKKLVAPHMLRRLKKDAMQNIPPKTERMVPVELTSIQAEYYRAMLTKNYQILRNIGKGAAMQSMLNIVMQLRKVCNHPYLIPGTEPESGSVEFLQEMRIKASAKLTLLHSMLKFLHKEGHRVLIFSQMTKLLDILEDYLTIEFGPKTFERVDGSVSVADRQAAITRFNKDKTRFVFLLSTRACGLGINLATADTVIIYDSDFNPHADIQAMNRAHRIGQLNRLLVYRLVVRASVEERILQLAKKKLMLDQLFVNKSESQKEVVDILRWGTEELFSERDGGKDLKETFSGKVDVVAAGEQKHRRRVGGLGDVYEDRCTDGCTKIIWDENAILKLLDRSNILSAVPESTEGDLDNDMLGSVKSLDWIDELNEEPGGTELLPGITGDRCDQPSEAKEENTISGPEENQWDRLLRLRWERYQIEEEAALGRGKRLRKVVSYKDTSVPVPSDAVSELSGNEEEPEPEYTPAGRALKEKFAKLRARQKERLAQRHITEVPFSTGKPQLLTQSPIPSVKGAEILDASKSSQDTTEQASIVNYEDTTLTQPFEAKKRSDSITSLRRFSKHGYKRFHSTHLDLSLRPGNPSPDIILPSNQFQSTTFASPAPSSNLLPVLGLCAPNANQVNSTSRNFQSVPSHKQRTTSGISEFQFPPTASAGPSSGMNIKGSGSTTDTSLFPDPLVEPLHSRLKSFIPDSYFPFCPPPHTASGSGSSGACFSAFKEKFGLPELIHEDKPALNFSFPSKDALMPHTDLLPRLSLGPKMESVDDSSQDLPNVPLAPTSGQQLSENLKQKQKMAKLPPMPDLDQVADTYSSLPENHKKVLEDIMMRTRFATNKFMKKRVKADAWSEDELDALWIGVRRHGTGNWDAMLRDSKLKFSKAKTCSDLSMKWGEEQWKILDGPGLASRMPSSSATFPCLSDGMMTRAFLGSKFSSLGMEPPELRPHFTDIQLGVGDLKSGFPLIDPDNHIGAVNESCPLLPTWKPDKFRSSFSGNISRPFVRLEKVKIPLDLPPQHPGESNMGMPLDPQKKQSSSSAPTIDDKEGSGSKTDKLPHWLRGAVSIPPSRPPECGLPPTVSAIAHSVRLLYGGDMPAIPPFTIPGPPPCQPKDPRKSLKKKRKLHTPQQAAHEIAGSKSKLDHGASSSIPPESQLTAGATSLDPNLSLSSLNSNLNPPSLSAFFVPGGSTSSTALTPSPEVVHSVAAASSVAPGPCTSPAPEMHTSKESAAFELARKRVPGDSEENQGECKERGKSLSGGCREQTNERIDRTESGDSTKKPRSDSGRAEQPQVGEISSEEIVSNDHQSEKEP